MDGVDFGLVDRSLCLLDPLLFLVYLLLVLTADFRILQVALVH